MNPGQLRKVVGITLQKIDAYTPDVTELLLMVAAHESHLGVYLMQDKGPALGIFQTEPATYNDIWLNYLKYNTALRMKILIGLLTPEKPPAERLATDIALAIMMARCQFLRSPAKIPPASDLQAMGELCKLVFNTVAGKATAQDYINDYRRYVLGIKL